MIKYGTLEIYQNTVTDEIVEIPLDNEEELKKVASSSEWVKITNKDKYDDKKPRQKETSSQSVYTD